MSTIEHGNDAGLDDFLAKWDLTKPETVEWVRGGMAVIGLTNFGERPLEITRLAEVLGMPVNEAEELMRRLGGWPGGRPDRPGAGSADHDPLGRRVHLCRRVRQ